VLEELIYRATQDRGRWIIGLAGVLLPGLRHIAAFTDPVSDSAARDVETDLLERLRVALERPRPAAVQLLMSILEAARRIDGQAQMSPQPSDVST
jgi:hypothetical protein